MNDVQKDTIIFYIGCILLIPVMFLGFWFADSGYQQIEGKFICNFAYVCKFPCPGCGGTRAVYYLFKGELFKSFIHHPCVLLGTFEYIHFMTKHISRKIFKRKNNLVTINLNNYIYIFVGMIIVQWILKVVLSINSILM